MFARGDIECVNLRTGERHRRAVGGGESFLESLGISGLKQVDPTALAEYEREMREEAIPEIIKAVLRRERLAWESRFRFLG